MHKHNDEWCYVGPDSAIDETGEAISDIVVLRSSVRIKSNIENQDPISKVDLEEIIESLLSFNTPEKVFSIIGMCGAFFLKPKQSLNGVRTPHLQLIGEPGSGKSVTKDNIIASLFSTSYNISADGLTKFTLLTALASSNIIPCLIDEFKSFKMKKEQRDLISENLRSAYDGSFKERGNQDKTVNEYQLLAPIVLAGETEFNETAITERSIVLKFFKKDIADKKKRDSFSFLCDNKNLLERLGKSLLLKALGKDIATLKSEREELLEFLNQSETGKQIETPRVKENLLTCMHGLKLFYDILSDFGIEPPVKKETAFEYIISSMFNDILEGNSTSKTSVENIIEVIDRMLGNGELNRIRDGVKECYDIRIIGENIAMNINHFYDRVLKYVPSHNIEIELLQPKEFISQLKKSGYLEKEKTKAVRFSDKTVKAYIFNFKKMQNNLTIDNIEDMHRKTYRKQDQQDEYPGL